jgi:hypothetical protein
LARNLIDRRRTMKRTIYAIVLSAIILTGCGGTGQRRVNPVPYEPSGRYIASEVASIEFKITASPKEGFYYGAGCAGSACNLLAQAAPRKAAMEEPPTKPVPESTKADPPADREAAPAQPGAAGGNVEAAKDAGAGAYDYPPEKPGRTLKVYKRE